MNELSPEQVAWLAGIYEGEGSCATPNTRSLRVQIIMTDHDVITRIHQMVGVGTLRGPYRRKSVKATNKPISSWSVGSADAVDFLEAVLPWLGERRGCRARFAIERWRTQRRQTQPNDTHCLYGHEFTPENTRPTYGGRGRACRTCHRGYSARYKERKRSERQVQS